jgi:hypothetical protein
MQLLILFNFVCWSLTWVKSNSQARQDKIIYLTNMDNRLTGVVSQWRRNHHRHHRRDNTDITVSRNWLLYSFITGMYFSIPHCSDRNLRQFSPPNVVINVIYIAVSRLLGFYSFMQVLRFRLWTMEGQLVLFENVVATFIRFLLSFWSKILNSSYISLNSLHVYSWHYNLTVKSSFRPTSYFVTTNRHLLPSFTKQIGICFQVLLECPCCSGVTTLDQFQGRRSQVSSGYRKQSSRFTLSGLGQPRVRNMVLLFTFYAYWQSQIA